MRSLTTLTSKCTNILDGCGKRCTQMTGRRGAEGEEGVVGGGGGVQALWVASALHVVGNAVGSYNSFERAASVRPNCQACAPLGPRPGLGLPSAPRIAFLGPCYCAHVRWRTAWRIFGMTGTLLRSCCVCWPRLAICMGICACWESPSFSRWVLAPGLIVPDWYIKTHQGQQASTTTTTTTTDWLAWMFGKLSAEPQQLFTRRKKNITSTRYYKRTATSNGNRRNAKTSDQHAGQKRNGNNMTWNTTTTKRFRTNHSCRNASKKVSKHS